MLALLVESRNGPGDRELGGAHPALRPGTRSTRGPNSTPRKWFNQQYLRMTGLMPGGRAAAEQTERPGSLPAWNVQTRAAALLKERATFIDINVLEDRTSSQGLTARGQRGGDGRAEEAMEGRCHLGP